MKKIVVLGIGLVGKAIAVDLSSRFNVLAVDINTLALDAINRQYGIATRKVNISDTVALKNLLGEFDFVVNASPGFLGFKTLQTIIECGKPVVDISFFPEDALALNELAVKNGVTAIMDCGVAPGIDNLLFGYHDTEMQLDYFECLVGGLPKARHYPFQYKAPFSPIDVIEEYTRPARYMENGFVVTRAPLTDPELVPFDKIGALEAFNTDGLRSLLFTMKHVPNMKEKTMRYPGHIDLIKALQAAGFFDDMPINVQGVNIRPMDFAAKILIDKWKLEPDEPEFTVMRVTMRGLHNGVRKELVYNLYDEYDPQTGFSSMARTTGFTCTAAVNLLADGLFDKTGVFPSELVGKEKPCFHYIMDYLAKRNITLSKTETTL